MGSVSLEPLLPPAWDLWWSRLVPWLKPFICWTHRFALSFQTSLQSFQIGMSAGCSLSSRHPEFTGPNQRRLVFPHHDPCPCPVPHSSRDFPTALAPTHKPSSGLAPSLHPTGLLQPWFPPSHRAQNLPAAQCSPRPTPLAAHLPAPGSAFPELVVNTSTE